VRSACDMTTLITCGLRLWRGSPSCRDVGAPTPTCVPEHAEDPAHLRRRESWVLDTDAGRKEPADA